MSEVYMHRDVCNERHDKLTGYIENNKRQIQVLNEIANNHGELLSRLTTLEELSTKSLQETRRCVEEAKEAVSRLVTLEAERNSRIENHAKRIAVLESKPGGKWEHIQNLVYGAVIGGIVSWLVAVVLNKV